VKSLRHAQKTSITGGCAAASIWRERNALDGRKSTAVTLEMRFGGLNAKDETNATPKMDERREMESFAFLFIESR
jgi:hypothetical protein